MKPKVWSQKDIDKARRELAVSASLIRRGLTGNGAVESRTRAE